MPGADKSKESWLSANKELVIGGTALIAGAIALKLYLNGGSTSGAEPQISRQDTQVDTKAPAPEHKQKHAVVLVKETDEEAAPKVVQEEQKSSEESVKEGPYDMLEAAFKRARGENAVEDLKGAIAEVPVISVGGDQLTGKSTLCATLVEKLNLTCRSAGSVFRAEAKRRGIPVGQLSIDASKDPNIDISIDYGVCEMLATGVANGDASKQIIVEGRQPAVMLKYMGSLGRTNRLSIYLSCSFRQQGLRFLQREISPEVFAVAEATLPDREYKDMLDVLTEVEKMPIPEDKLAKIKVEFTSNAKRDASDCKRYKALYGSHPLLDYHNPEVYDVILDTTKLNKEATVEAALKAIKEWKAKMQA